MKTSRMIDSSWLPRSQLSDNSRRQPLNFYTGFSFQLLPRKKCIPVKSDDTLFRKHSIETFPEIFCFYLIYLDVRFLRTEYSSTFHSQTKVCQRDHFGIAVFPRFLTTQYAYKFYFFTTIQPGVLQLFISDPSLSFALRSAVFNVILVYGFKRECDLFWGSSSRVSIEIPSLAMTANFSMICQRSHCKGGSSVGLSQKGSIPRSARSLVADCAM